MNFRLRVALWFSLSVVFLAGVLVWSAHYHLDEELRKDRWDRSHPDFPNWVIHGSYTDEEVHDILGELLQVWMWVGIPVVAASAVAGWFIARRSIRPIRKINRELAALDFRTLHRGVQLPEKDAELANLVSHLNDLLARLRTSYVEMEEFSARVAHELRTPLTILRMKTEATASRLPADFSEDFQEEISRLTKLVENLLLTAKADGGKLEVNKQPIGLTDVLNDLQEGYDLLAEERNLSIEWIMTPGLMCQTDPVYLRQILHNLLGNAAKHGTDTIKVHLFEHKKMVFLTISNRIKPESESSHRMPQGLRVVRSLIAAMDGHSLRLRKSRSIFSVRLGFLGQHSGRNSSTKNTRPHHPTTQS
jgi:signal transduction histidine kinase